MEKQLDELPKIADTLEQMQAMIKGQRRSADALDWGVFVIIILLELILWRVW